MRTNTHYYLIATVIFCAVLCGCGLIGRPNTRVLTWNNVTAEYHLYGRGNAYTDVVINFEEGAPSLTIRMPDRKWLQTSGLQLEKLEPYTPPLLKENFSDGRIIIRILFDKGNCTNFWGYSGGGYAFEFQNDRLVTIRARANPSFSEDCRPGFGKATDSLIYTLPLSEEKLVSLFGPYSRKEDVWSGF